MSSSKFLDYEVALLFAKYGKNAVLDAVAKKLQLRSDELEAILQTALNEKPISHAGKRPSPAELIAQLTKECPSKAQFLRTLHTRFENRVFLPELRDVKRFFERHGRHLGSSKSRAESVTKVLTLLAELDVAELEALCHAQPENEYSSLAIISDAILRKDK
jgi:hypothetical protein